MTIETPSNTVTPELMEQLQHLRQSLRPGQQSLADWKGGKMAVSAVPGAGKSHSLAVAAVLAIARYQLHNRKQLVIVTYTRSAAASIKKKIKEQLEKLNLPKTGFTVQTLHGLALQIASRHPNLSQLNLDTSTLVIPTPSHRIIRACVEQWISATPGRYKVLIETGEFDGEETERLRRQSVLRTEVLPNLAYTIVKEAKSSGLSPNEVWDLSQYTQDSDQILAIGAGLYEQYERLMRSRNYIDYEDLILAALRVLKNEEICHQWQNQVYGVFEDEAQDSSPLQGKLINLLATHPHDSNSPPNLIRVGDPNQAINSTFTPADPVYFNWFCNQCKLEGNLATMDQGGRSSEIIIKAANFTLHWMCQTWLTPTQKNQSTLQDSQLPFRLQDIQLVRNNDPQPEANPEPVGQGLELYFPEDIFQTVDLIEKRVIELFKQNRGHNAAILVRENRQGRFLAEKFAHRFKDKEPNIKVYEVSEVDRSSQIPDEIFKLLKFIDRPHSSDALKAALEILEKRGLIPAQDLNALATYPETFLYPTPLEPPQKPPVEQARRYCCNLLKAKIELPHYQLIPFLGMTLKYSGSELATVQKLADRIYQEISGNNSLKTMLTALSEIINSERFQAIEEDNEDSYTNAGQLTIITMHKAKGLDWDYVFIPFLHEDVLPGQPWIPTGAKFLGDFTLGEVARAQIRAAVHSQHQNPDILPRIPQPTDAWQEANQLKKAEEFRLLYVAMTRAKRLLWISAAKQGPFRWNVFRGDRNNSLQNKTPCPVLSALTRRFPASVMMG